MKKRFRMVMIGLGVLAALIFAAACEGPVTPEPTPTPKPAPIPDINSVAFGAGRYVAVGDEGAIFSSSDGLTWSRKDSKTTRTLHSVIYENNLFVAVGNNDIIRTSPNGEEWAAGRYIGEGGYLLSTVYENGQFVIVGGRHILDTNLKIIGNKGVIATSTNGITWNERSLPSTVPRLNSITHAGGKFVAAGNGETIVTSTDGITWSRTHPASSSSTANHLLKVIPAAGGFVAVGENGVVLTSSNGTTWSRSTVGRTYRDGSKNILFGAAYKPGGNYVVTGNRGTVLHSSNGTSWTSVLGVEPGLADVIYADGKFVAVGGPQQAILISSDGVTWNYRNVGERGTGVLFTVIHGGGKFVAVGAKGIIFTSTDGVNWVKGKLN